MELLNPALCCRPTIAHRGAAGDRCTAGLRSGVCPLWVKSGGAGREDAAPHVRFTPKSGHPAGLSESPLCPKAVIAVICGTGVAEYLAGATGGCPILFRRS